MEKILLIADDITSKEFDVYINSQSYTSQISTELLTVKKEGKSLIVDTLVILFSDDISKNIVAAILYDLIKFGLASLNNFFAAKPVAKIELKNGIKIELPHTLSQEEVYIELQKCLALGIKSIHFES